MRYVRLLLITLLLAVSTGAWAAIPRYSTNPHDFVSSHLGHFWVDGQPMRFMGFNMRAFVHYGYPAPKGETVPADKETSVAEMQRWGARVARVFVPFKMISPQEVGDRLDVALQVASRYDVRLICVLTDSYEITSLYPMGDLPYHTAASGFMNEYWYHEAYQFYYKPMALYLANRFKNDPTVFCWQLANEPKCLWENTTPGNDLAPFSRDMTASIRAVDPNHMISLGTVGTGYAFLSDQEARDVYANFDFLTVHSYDGDDSEAGDAALAQELGKPLLISEAGFHSSHFTDHDRTRSNATDADIAKWVGRGARGYMNWAFCALGRYAGDLEPTGVDDVIHDDWGYYKEVYTKWANIFSNTPRPAPEKASNTQATDGAYPDRVGITWDPAWAANEYAVYRSEPLADPDAVVNVMPYALSYVECGHLDAGTTVEKMLDGDLSTRWACNHNSGAAGDHEVVFDLGSTVEVSRFVIKHASSNGVDPATLNTKLFYIYSGASINGPWNQLYMIYNAQMNPSHTLTLPAPQDIRYLRLRIVYPNSTGDYTARIQEFEVWGIPGAGLTRQISDWHTATSFVDTTAVPGVNYLYSVNARNEAGESGCTPEESGYAQAAAPMTMAQAKSCADGTEVYVTGGVVSAAYGGSFYIQQPDRTGGIHVVWDGEVTEGSAVNVSGTMTTADGERTITASAVTPAQ